MCFISAKVVIFLLRLPFYQASEHDILRTNKPILMRIDTLVHEAAASNDQLCESEGKDQGHMRPKIDLEACLALASFSSHFARTAFIVFFVFFATRTGRTVRLIRINEG